MKQITNAEILIVPNGKDQKIPFWVVRAVRIEEAEGTANRRHEPYIEFYDPRYSHTNLGQFTGRYYADTIKGCSGGLSIQAGVGDWTVSPEAMNIVRRWISENEKLWAKKSRWSSDPPISLT